MASQDASRSRTYEVPQRILAESADLLRSLGEGVRESVVLWVGVERASTAEVRRIVVPRYRSWRLGFDVPIEERLEIARQLAQSDEKLLAQLHTHPGSAFHSRTDDRLALPRHTGAISIVVADFATAWDGDLQRVSVNRHLGAGVWRELSRAAVSKLFQVTDAAP